MTAMIRFYSLDSKSRCAQLTKEERGSLCVCSFKDKSERIHCVIAPGGLE